jgi:hypothetical protein
MKWRINCLEWWVTKCRCIYCTDYLALGERKVLFWWDLSFQGVKGSWHVRLTTSLPPVSWLPRKMWEPQHPTPYRPPKSVTGILFTICYKLCNNILHTTSIQMLLLDYPSFLQALTPSLVEMRKVWKPCSHMYAVCECVWLQWRKNNPVQTRCKRGDPYDWITGSWLHSCG